MDRAVRIVFLLLEYSTEYLIEYSSSLLIAEIAINLYGGRKQTRQNESTLFLHFLISGDAMITSSITLDPRPGPQLGHES